MHRTASSIAEAPADDVFAIVSDLATYSGWLDLVVDAETAEAQAGDPGPAWMVTIRAKVGPLARSKKLRMVRSSLEKSEDEGGLAFFERREVDGRDHAAWTLRAEVAAKSDNACAVDMELRYEGGLWTTPLEPILGTLIDGAGEHLTSYANR